MLLELIGIALLVPTVLKGVAVSAIAVQEIAKSADERSKGAENKDTYMGRQWDAFERQFPNY